MGMGGWTDGLRYLKTEHSDYGHLENFSLNVLPVIMQSSHIVLPSFGQGEQISLPLSYVPLCQQCNSPVARSSHNDEME